MTLQGITPNLGTPNQAPGGVSLTTTTAGPGGTKPGFLQQLAAGESGWAIVIGFGIGIFAGNTQFAPLVAGVLGVGILYQLINIVQGKKVSG